MRAYHTLPQNPSGYWLDEQHDWFWVVDPVATENLFTNPSFETGVDGWTITEDGSDALSGVYPQESFRGLWALGMVVSSDGTYVQAVSTTNATAGTTTTVSFHVKFATASTREFDPTAHVRIVVDGLTLVPSLVWRVGGGWWRVGITYTPAGTNPVGIRLIGEPDAFFVMDCAQWENLSYWTTYCDGDERGLLPLETPLPYVWTGEPHASTSRRSFQTRAGGRYIPLSDYGFKLLAIEGLGSSEIAHARQEVASADGSIYKTSRRPSRTFTLGGKITADTPRLLSQQRGELREVLDPARTGLRQPLVLLMQKHDGEAPITELLQCICTYDGGLEGDHRSEFDEEVAIVFTADSPYLATVRHLAYALTAEDVEELAPTYAILRANGEVELMNGPSNSAQSDLIQLSDGRYLFSRNAASGPTYVDPVSGNLTNLGGGTRPAVTNVEMPNGDIVAVGTTALLNYISRWDGGSWNAYGTGLNNTATAGILGPNGYLYVCGTFTTANGVAVDGITYWNNTTFVAMGNPGIGTHLSLAVDAAEQLYVSGANGIARWEGGTTWTVIGTPAGDTLGVVCISIGRDGRLYAFGDFTSMDGVAAQGIAVWNGATWQPIAQGVEINVSLLSSKQIDVNPLTGELLIAAIPEGFNGVAGWTPANTFSIYSTGVFRRPNINLAEISPPINHEYPVLADRDGNFLFRHGAGVLPTTFTVVPNVTSYASPYATAERLRIYYLSDAAQRLDSFDFFKPIGSLILHMDVFDGEQITVEVTHRGLGVKSNVRPMLGTPLFPGSQVTRLLPIKGTNNASYLTELGTDGSAWIVIEPAVLSLDEAKIV